MTDNDTAYMPECWLIRHGETEWSLSRQHTGRTDLPLTANGEATAGLLKQRLEGVHFDLELASPLKRAWHTAELAGLTPQPEPNAMEWDYGIYEGRTSTEIKEKDPDWSIWTDPVPDGEDLDAVGKRADAVIARICAEAKTRAVLVSHAHFLRIFAARWIGADPALAQHLALETAAVSVLTWDRGTPMIDRWNG